MATYFQRITIIEAQFIRVETGLVDDLGTEKTAFKGAAEVWMNTWLTEAFGLDKKHAKITYTGLHSPEPLKDSWQDDKWVCMKGTKDGEAWIGWVAKSREYLLANLVFLLGSS
jgi:hypothetical protein